MYYLNGLLSFTIHRNQRNLSSKDLQDFRKSLSCSSNRINSLSKKTFFKLLSIVDNLIEPRVIELERLNNSGALQRNSGFSRRLTKLLLERRPTIKEELTKLQRGSSKMSNHNDIIVQNDDDSMSQGSGKTITDILSGQSPVNCLKSKLESLQTELVRL